MVLNFKIPDIFSCTPLHYTLFAKSNRCLYYSRAACTLVNGIDFHAWCMVHTRKFLLKCCTGPMIERQKRLLNSLVLVLSDIVKSHIKQPRPSAREALEKTFYLHLWHFGRLGYMNVGMWCIEDSVCMERLWVHSFAWNWILGILRDVFLYEVKIEKTKVNERK